VCAKFYAFPQQFLPGHVYWGGAVEAMPGEPGYGALRAIDPVSGLGRWEFKYPRPFCLMELLPIWVGDFVCKFERQALEVKLVWPDLEGFQGLFHR
jgi:hypothetical protein